jgi:DNA repair protein radc
MSMKHWPEAEKPHNKICDRGSQFLSDAELLALFLKNTAEKDAVSLGREILFKYGSLRAIFDAPEADLCAMAGINRATYAQLKGVVELSRRYLGEKMRRGAPLSDPDAVRFYLMSRLRDLKSEVFVCVWVDNRHRVIAYEELFFGTIDGASVHPRKVVRRALHHNAAAVIFAHNHPSGVAEPSQADERITQKLKDALHLIDVRVLDHFVIGDQVVSFAERGLL